MGSGVVCVRSLRSNAAPETTRRKSGEVVKEGEKRYDPNLD